MLPQKYVTFKADGSKETGEFNTNTWLKLFQGIVGGWIEPVYLEKFGLVMWGNEEARLLNHTNSEGVVVEGLPFNAHATAIVRDGFFPNPTIDMLGDVAFTSIKTTSAGNTYGVSDEQLQMLMAYETKANDSGSREVFWSVSSVD
jgi:hypothetical protein